MWAPDYPLKNHLSLRIDITDDTIHVDAARFVGLTYEQFMTLPGNPRWVDMDSQVWSKADVIVYYLHKKALDAVVAEASAKN